MKRKNFLTWDDVESDVETDVHILSCSPLCCCMKAFNMIFLLSFKELLLPLNMHIVKHTCNKNNFSIFIVAFIRTLDSHFYQIPIVRIKSINDIVNYIHFRLRSWLLTNFFLCIPAVMEHNKARGKRA